MTGITNISGEDLKAQLSEYHLIVAEVIGGISADLIESKKRIDSLDLRVQELCRMVDELNTTTRLLVHASLPKESE